MIDVLKQPTYARLFGAQVIALLGTGLLTVALSLLAFDLAGDQAGSILGTVFAIKMVSYVGLAPFANAISDRFPRKVVLIGADVVRATVALSLPFVDAVWQVYAAVFVLQAASATFTPIFQAVIPDILPEEKDYTQALSLSRLAYDLENLISPIFAGALLSVMSYHWLFGGTVIGFAGSTLLIALSSISIPNLPGKDRRFMDRVTRGIRIYLATPRLRGLLALNLSAASAGAFVLVNTVVIVRTGYDATVSHVAYALAAFGGGSMISALALPKVLEIVSDRKLMISAAFLLAGLTLLHALYFLTVGLAPWAVFLSTWVCSGVLYSAILTPSGRLLRHSAHAENRPAIFSAQFVLSHLCWLFTYPIAGWAGELFGLPVAMAILGAVAFAGWRIALSVWPVDHVKELFHEHPDLSPDHPHLQEYQVSDHQHRHIFVIDDEHNAWPTNG